MVKAKRVFDSIFLCKLIGYGRISFILLACLTACSDHVEEENRAIRFGLATAPITLDPRFATDAVSVRIVELITARLIQFDQYAQVEPSLANWQVLSPTHYRFHLGPDYRQFHDGTWLTADDVVATYQSVLDKKTASPHRSSLSHIQRVIAIDKNTVDFILSHADPLFVGRCVIGILPARKIASQYAFHVNPIGSGPLRFVRWPQSGKLTLERVQDNQTFHFLTVKDPTVRALKLVKGELDLFQGEIPYELLPWLKARDGIVLEQASGSTFSYLGFNLEDTQLRQQQVRQAISLAINREAIIQYVFRGAARPANGLFAPEHWVGLEDDLLIKYEPERARKLLSANGITPDTPIELVYKTSSNPFRVRLATILQAQLKEFGVHLKIQSLDWGTFYGDVKAGRFQLYSLSWVGLKLPDAFRMIFHSDSFPPDGSNRGRLKDAELDQMIEKAELLVSHEQQSDDYRKIQRYIFETLPIIPLWYEDVVLVRRGSVRGYTLARDGAYSGLVETRVNE